MTKFNKPIPASSSIKADSVATGMTHEGAPGFARDVKSELFLLGVSNFVGEDTFYESRETRDARFKDLVREVALLDIEWLTKFTRWLRNESNMRSAPLVIAAEAVKARLDAKKPGGNREIILAAMSRADEPGEFLAYWISQYGDKLPMPVKRGVADAVNRLYNEYAYIKYDPDKGIRFSDVIQLTHPKPRDSRQGMLFKHILDMRYTGEPDLILGLPILDRNREIRRIPVERRRAVLLTNPELLQGSGFTWEQVSGWIQGEMTGPVWDAVIPSMGYMAILRNLRNFEVTGISHASQVYVHDYLTNPDNVAASRQFPFRFLSARRNVQGYFFLDALETALQLSLRNVPLVNGRTLILVDRSGSMFHSPSEKSKMTMADMAALFGTAIAARCTGADLVEFGTSSRTIIHSRYTPILETVNQFSNMGMTNTAMALRNNWNGHDRVILLTDEQRSHHDYTGPQIVPNSVPLYIWNFVGYKHSFTPGQANRYFFGGLTDASFKAISLLERHRNGSWPWE